MSALRIMYAGMDNRVRVASATRVKFMEDGFQRTDKPDERGDGVSGPVIVAHVDRAKGGKRLTMHAPDKFDMEAAKAQLLEKGWLDLSACTVVAENLY